MTLKFDKVSIEIGSKVILKEVSFQLGAGDFVALIGQNGAGKTTILRSIIRLIKPIVGRIEIDGHDLQSLKQSEVGQYLSYVPQSVQVVFDAKASQFFENIEDSHVSKLVSELNIREFLDRRFLTLSGGERQRVLLASALSRKPKLLLLDELTQYADAATTNLLGQFLSSYCVTHGITILAISHDIHWIKQFTKSALLLKDGIVTKLTLAELASYGQHIRDEQEIIC